MNTTNPIFPKGDPAAADHFSGTVWVKHLVKEALYNCAVVNITFEPGGRTNWHSHPGGQLLLVTEGTGFYQEKGKEKQTIRKGDVIEIIPDVVHWHGATSENSMTHIALNTNSDKGAVTWLEKVPDDQYAR